MGVQDNIYPSPTKRLEKKKKRQKETGLQVSRDFLWSDAWRVSFFLYQKEERTCPRQTKRRRKESIPGFIFTGQQRKIRPEYAQDRKCSEDWLNEFTNLFQNQSSLQIKEFFMSSTTVPPSFSFLLFFCGTVVEYAQDLFFNLYNASPVNR